MIVRSDQHISLYFLLFFNILAAAHGAKILFISPNLSNSMVLFTGRMADVLVKAGHNVTFFIPATSQFNKMNGTRLARVVRMEDLGSYFDDLMISHGDPFDPPQSTFFNHRMEVVSQYKICEEILKRKHELAELAAAKFDLAISDNVDFCDLSLAHMLNIPLRIHTTTGPIHEMLAWAMGIPAETAYVPTTWDNYLGPVMSLYERAYNFFQHHVTMLHAIELDYQVTRLFRKYVRPDFPSAASLAANTDLLFINGDQFFDPVRPLPSRCINIGGVGQAKPQRLPAKFEEVTLKGRKGFVVFSLGTAAPTRAISLERRRALADAFAQFPDYHFIVKTDKADYDFQNLTRQMENVDIFDWVPQSDLLAHPRARLLITHAGYNSIIEAGIRGVPMLMLPLFFDQHRNARAVEYRGLGLALEPYKVTAESVTAALNTLLNDEAAATAARRQAQLFRTKPDQPDETLVKWVDFVLQNGNLKELKPELANLSLIAYNNWDVFFVLIATFATLVFGTRALYNYLIAPPSERRTSTTLKPQPTTPQTPLHRSEAVN